MNIKRAIISVYNKDGLEEFATFLRDNNVEIISTGGTAEYLTSKGIEVVKISDYTGSPEILGGRVKTLHPKLFGGVLAKWGVKTHEEDLEKYNIPTIDLVIVNFYPFEEVAASTTQEKELLENIDIGGFALLRAAAKNYRDVIPLVDPEDYGQIMENIQECGDVPLHLRRKMALKAFYSTSKYDSSIHKELSELYASEKFEHEFFEILGILRYGENPMQDAMLYKFAGQDSVFDNIFNLTKHKAPTFRATKDLSILFKVASKTNKDMIAFAKKGTFVFGIVEPTAEDYEMFMKHIDKMRGGIVYTDNEEMIEKLRKYPIDGVLTSKDISLNDPYTYKGMVFKMNKKEFSIKEEYVIDQDLVIKEEVRKVNADLPEFEKIGFEVAKIHRSDTVVYVNGNKIYSGVQNALNRKFAMMILEEIVNEVEMKMEGGTLIFDSGINNEHLVNRIKELKFTKVVIPPPMPSEKDFVAMVKENGTEVFITQNRYHRY